MNEKTDNTFEQAAAFQKIWMDSFSKIAQAAMTLSPDSTPPEVVKQMRSGIFQAVAQAWEEFMRSPQFLGAMKQLMEHSVNLRKQTNDFLTKAHHDLQGTARTDIDTIMLALRHMETQVLNRVEGVAQRLDAIEERLGRLEGAPAKGEDGQPTSRLSKRVGRNSRVRNRKQTKKQVEEAK